MIQARRYTVLLSSLKFNKLLNEFSTYVCGKMRLVGLISGGKDSCYSMMQCVAAGHEIVALAHLQPSGDKEEIDSYMYQTVGYNAINLYADAMSLPLYQGKIHGSSICKDLLYKPTSGDEVEDLFKLLEKIKEELQIEGVASGAILSDYQRLRVENVCFRLGLTSYSYLWRRDQEELLSEMIANHVNAIVVKVAALGLKIEDHLGKEISELFPHFVEMKRRYQLNICGEGGEYETLTLDCPLFNKKIVIDDQEIIIHSNDAIAPVGYISIKKAHLEPKSGKILSQMERIKEVGVCSPHHFLLDLNLSSESNLAEELSEELSEFSSKNTDIDFNSCRHTQIIKSDHGWFFVPEFQIPVEADAFSSVTLVLTKLKELLRLQGLHLEDIITVHLLVNNMKDFLEINNAYKSFFMFNPPSRVCVQVPLPKNVIGVFNCIGFHEKSCSSSITKHMHVQSVSHWAPANIGPYSQAVQVDNFIYVAGQIALVPGTMLLISGGIVAESILAIRHVKRVLEAMNSDLNLSSVIFGICYVTQNAFISVAKQVWEKNINSEAAKDIMNYVVVPELPRGSAVEWQVVAYNSYPSGWLEQNLEDIVINGCLLQTVINQIETEEKVERILKAKCSLISGTSINFEGSTLPNIFQQLANIATKFSTSANFQVFYSNSKIEYSLMLTSSQENLSRSNSVFNCIPLQSLESSSCLLIIFGRLI